MTKNSNDPLIVWQDSTRLGHQLAQAIVHVRKNARLALGDLAAVGAEATKLASGSILLLHAPRHRMCQLMENGDLPDQALDAWLTESQAIADLMRQHRARTTLLDAAVARQHPAATSAMLGLKDETAEWAADAEAIDPVLELMAAHVLDSTPKARALLGVLEASAVDLSDGQGPRRVDTDAAFKAYRAACAIEEAQAELVQLQKREETAQETIQTLEKEAQTHQQTAEMMAQQQAAMATELSLLHERRDQMEARIAQMSQGMDSYQQQIASLQRDVELRVEKLAMKNAQLDSMAHSVRTLQAEIDRVHNSYSMRLTSPLRFVTRLLRGGKNG